MDNLEFDKLKELIKNLSKSEREKLFANFERVTFNFQVNQSFLKGSHPITIPKEYYSFLDIHGILEKKDTTILFPDGSTALGYIYHGSTPQWGEYRQIKIRNPYSGKGLAMLRIGNRIKVEIYKEDDLARIQISDLS